MSKDQYIALVYRNLKSDLSPNEFKQLNDLTARDAAMSNLRLEIEDAWDASGEASQVITQKETNQLVDKIINKKNTSDSAAPSTSKVYNLKKVLINIAALLVFALAAVWVMRDQVTVYDTAGQYTLADNSTVDLREGSILEVSPFDNQTRNLKLTGEAFFNVSKDADRPFVVTTQDTRTEVLGTSFLIKETSKNTYIDLKTGKVNFSSNTSNSEMILTPGMKAVYNGVEIDAVTEYQNLSGWKDGIYQYKDAQLSTILDELKIIFDTDILTTDPLLYDCTLSAILSADSIDDVLAQIASQLDMKVTGGDSKWTLTGGKCK